MNIYTIYNNMFRCGIDLHPPPNKRVTPKIQKVFKCSAEPPTPARSISGELTGLDWKRI